MAIRYYAALAAILAVVATSASAWTEPTEVQTVEGVVWTLQTAEPNDDVHGNWEAYLEYIGYDAHDLSTQAGYRTAFEATARLLVEMNPQLDFNTTMWYIPNDRPGFYEIFAGAEWWLPNIPLTQASVAAGTISGDGDPVSELGPMEEIIAQVDAWGETLAGQVQEIDEANTAWREEQSAVIAASAEDITDLIVEDSLLNAEIGALQIDVEEVARNVGDLETVTEDLTTTTEHLTRNVGDLSSDVTENRIGGIALAAALLLVLGSLGYFCYRLLGKRTDEIAANLDEVKHAVIADLEAVGKIIEAVDDKATRAHLRVDVVADAVAQLTFDRSAVEPRLLAGMPVGTEFQLSLVDDNGREHMQVCIERVVHDFGNNALIDAVIIHGLSRRDGTFDQMQPVKLKEVADKIEGGILKNRLHRTVRSDTAEVYAIAAE